MDKAHSILATALAMGLTHSMAYERTHPDAQTKKSTLSKADQEKRRKKNKQARKSRAKNRK